MHPSPSRLPESHRRRVCDALDAVLANSVDLYGQLKIAHWNVKGPHFAALHPLFENFATAVLGFNDEVAERILTLGGLAGVTVRAAAAKSKLPEYPTSVVRDLEHVKHLADRLETHLETVRSARAVADEAGDPDTSDLLTGMAQELEKDAWMLRATIG